MNPKDIRKKLGLTQAEFWPPIGVTQSGGSRYEGNKNRKARPMPKPVAILFKLRYEYPNHYGCGFTNLSELIAKLEKQLRRKS